MKKERLEEKKTLEKILRDVEVKLNELKLIVLIENNMELPKEYRYEWFSDYYYNNLTEEQVEEIWKNPNNDEKFKEEGYPIPRKVYLSIEKIHFIRFSQYLENRDIHTLTSEKLNEKIDVFIEKHKEDTYTSKLLNDFIHEIIPPSEIFEQLNSSNTQTIKEHAYKSIVHISSKSSNVFSKKNFIDDLVNGLYKHFSSIHGEFKNTYDKMDSLLNLLNYDTPTISEYVSAVKAVNEVNGYVESLWTIHKFLNKILHDELME